MRGLIAVLLAALATSACDNHRDPCIRDSFFCSHPRDWHSSASQLDTRRVFELNVIAQESIHPAPDIFIDILGHRGEETVKILLEYMRNNPEKRSFLFYRPILHDVIYNGRFDFCNSEYRTHLQSILSLPNSRSFDSSEELRVLREFCVSEMGSLPDDNNNNSQ